MCQWHICSQSGEVGYAYDLGRRLARLVVTEGVDKVLAALSLSLALQASSLPEGARIEQWCACKFYIGENYE